MPGRRWDTGIIESHDAVACYEGFECSRYCFFLSHGVSFCLAVVINKFVESLTVALLSPLAVSNLLIFGRNEVYFGAVLAFALFPAVRRGSAADCTRTLTHGCPNSWSPVIVPFWDVYAMGTGCGDGRG